MIQIQKNVKCHSVAIVYPNIKIASYFAQNDMLNRKVLKVSQK